MYDEIVQEIVSSVCTEGRNGTVFTYGQTSTGKTYTMHGIICFAARDIFQYAADSNAVSDSVSTPAKKNASITCVRVSCMELYNEELRDLLCTPNGNSMIESGHSSPPVLSIKEDRCGNVQIPHLTEKKVTDIEELLKFINIAEKNRTVGSTAMNERSSRSHTIFQITYEEKVAKETTVSTVMNTDNGMEVECTLEEVEDNQKENGYLDGGGISDDRSKKGNKKVVTTVSTLNLVDLAGSESVRLTNASGVRQKEGGKINQR